MLGKVSVVPRGQWNSLETYEKLDIVRGTDGSYIAISNVPLGTPVNNGEYWMKLVNDGSEGGGGGGTVVIDNTLTSNATDEAASANTVRLVNEKIEGHLSNSTQKHFEIIDELPSTLTGENLFLLEQDGSGDVPNTPNSIDLDEYKDLVGSVLSVATDYGLIPNDPLADNKNAIASLLGNSVVNAIYIPEGTFHTTRVATNINNKIIKGIPGKTKLQTSGSELLFMQTCQNVVFEDIEFIATSTSQTNGVVTHNGGGLNNITFIRCKFKTNGSNGIKVINENATKAENVRFLNCDFSDIGRMGAEFQNHNDTTVEYRYDNIEFIGCKFKNIGAVAHGMGISMSGKGRNVTVKDCEFSECVGPALELIGANYVTADNNLFHSETIQMVPVSIANNRPNDHIVFTNNKGYGNLGRLNIYNGQNILIEGNDFEGINRVNLKGIFNSKVVNNVFSSKDGECLFLDGSGRNEIYGNILKTTDSPTNYTCCKLYGADTKYNKFYNNRMYRANGGLWVDEVSSASENFIGENYNDSVIKNGLDTNISQFHLGKRVNSSSLKTSVTIELKNGSSWYPFTMQVTCMGVENGGGNLFTTICRVDGKAHTSLEFTKADVVTSSTAAITVTKSGKTLTFECTHTTPNQMWHTWSITGVSQNQVVFI